MILSSFPLTLGVVAMTGAFVVPQSKLHSCDRCVGSHVTSRGCQRIVRTCAWIPLQVCEQGHSSRLVPTIGSVLPEASRHCQALNTHSLLEACLVVDPTHGGIS